MKKFYYSSVTEYELGWGQRSDGYLICFDKKTLENHIKIVDVDRDYELYNTYSEIEEIFCSKEEFERFQKETNPRKEDRAVMWIKSLKEYKFFKEA